MSVIQITAQISFMSVAQYRGAQGTKSLQLTVHFFPYNACCDAFTYTQVNSTVIMQRQLRNLLYICLKQIY